LKTTNKKLSIDDAMILTWNAQVIVLMLVETFHTCNYCYEIVGKGLL
jgi:hypothetical protein